MQQLRVPAGARRQVGLHGIEHETEKIRLQQRSCLSHHEQEGVSQYGDAELARKPPPRLDDE